MKRLALILLAAAILACGSSPAWAETTGDDTHRITDARPGYQAQATCSPAPKPGTVALLDLLVQRWGGSSWGISRGCEVGGRSEHKEGRALDWHMDVADRGDRMRVAEALDWLTADNGRVAAQLGVMYIIWDQKLWASYRKGQGWRPMADRGSGTANHKDHVHISLTWDGAMQQTSWWTGVPVTDPLDGPCGVAGARECRPPTGTALASILPGAALEPIPPTTLPEPAEVPLVGGSPQVGHLLQLVPGTWVPEGSELAVQWVRDGIPIPQANESTYAVTPLDLGAVLLVRVMAFSPDGSVAIRLTDELPPVAPAPFRDAPAPVIAGEPAVGRLLSVDPGLWRPFPATLTFQWLREGRPIPGATAYSYRATAGDLAARISVTVTATAAGFTPTTLTSAAAAPVRRAALVAPVPVVKGEREAGRTLTALPGSWQPTPTDLDYQWFRDGRAIKGATDISYRLTAADVGAVVRVRVQGSRPGYPLTSVMSVPDRAVRAAAPGPSTTPITPTPSPSDTPSPSTTPSETAGPSATPSDTASPSATPPETASPSATPSAAAPSATPSPDPSEPTAAAASPPAEEPPTQSAEPAAEAAPVAEPDPAPPAEPGEPGETEPADQAA